MKMSNLKSGKICTFGKGLAYGFGLKFAFFYRKGPKKVFHDVLDRK